jgi:hypothetical protein
MDLNYNKQFKIRRVVRLLAPFSLTLKVCQLKHPKMCRNQNL